MCTFLGLSKIALSFGAVGKEGDMRKSRPLAGKSGLALFTACLRRNRENRRNGE
jgi:hypothetical protein